MSAYPLLVSDTGLVTSVGLSCESSCAAIRCGISNFHENYFIDHMANPILVSSVPLPDPWDRRARLREMLLPALKECFASVPAEALGQVPLLLCVAELDRAGRLEDLEFLRKDLQDALGSTFHHYSRIFTEGKVGVALALRSAQRLLHAAGGGTRWAIIGSADSLLLVPTLDEYDAQNRLLTETNSDGFVPGEGAAALLLERYTDEKKGFVVQGVGFGLETGVPESGTPPRGHGLMTAVSSALEEAGLMMNDVDYRIADIAGEQTSFIEAELALSRITKSRRVTSEVWHPADCVGEIGSAAIPCMLSVAREACIKGYARGPVVLCHAGNDDGRRAAVIGCYRGND